MTVLRVLMVLREGMTLWNGEGTKMGKKDEEKIDS
jgi:hypothetical protein